MASSLLPIFSIPPMCLCLCVCVSLYISFFDFTVIILIFSLPYICYRVFFLPSLPSASPSYIFPLRFSPDPTISLPHTNILLCLCLSVCLSRTDSLYLSVSLALNPPLPIPPPLSPAHNVPWDVHPLILETTTRATYTAATGEHSQCQRVPL